MSNRSRLIVQPLTGDDPEIVVLRDGDGLYRVERLNTRSSEGASGVRTSMRVSTALREQRFASLEDLEAAVARELARRPPAHGGETAQGKGTKLASVAIPDTAAFRRGKSGRHPRWLDREMAAVLEDNGYMHNVAGGFYFADEDSVITETQLLVSDLEGLRNMIAKQRAKPARR